MPQLPRIQAPICRLCGRGKDCCTCEGHRRHYERCVAPFYYEGKAKTAILRFKEGARQIAGTMADEMAAVVKQEYNHVTFDYIISVPMTPKAQKKRGYKGKHS